jgi:hypothetical protein
MSDLRTLLDMAAPVPPLIDIPAIRRGAARRRRRRRLTYGVVIAALAVAATIAMPARHSKPSRVDVFANEGESPGHGWAPLAIPGVVDNDSHVSVLTPDGVFVWAGTFASVVDPVTGSVSGRPTPPRPSPSDAAIAWTGTEVVVFGGRTEGGVTYTGTAFNPETREWRTFFGPMSARTPMAYAWTGTELLIFGSTTPAAPAEESAAYDPAKRTWRPLASTPPELTPIAGATPGESGNVTTSSMWTGNRLLVVAAARGRTNGKPGSFAFSYDPSTDTWSRLPDPGLSERALWAVWDGNRVVAWDYKLRARTWAPDEPSWQPLPDLPFAFSECSPGGAVAPAGELVATYCGGAAVLDTDRSEWARLPDPPASLIGTVHGDDGGFTIVGPHSARFDLSALPTKRVARCPDTVHPFERPPTPNESGDGLPPAGTATKAAAERVAAQRAAAGVSARVRAVNGRAWTRDSNGLVLIVDEVIYMVEVEVPTAQGCGPEPAFYNGVPMSVVYRRP